MEIEKNPAEQEKIKPELQSKPINKKPKSNKKPFIWGLVVGLVIIVIIMIGFGAYRLYKAEATDSYTMFLAKYLPFPAATVNGQTITYNEVKTDTDTLLYYLEQQAENNSLYEVPSYDEIFQETLTGLIEQAIIEQEAEQRNIEVTQEEIDQNLEEIKQAAESAGEEVEVTLEQRYGWTIDQFIDRALRPQLLQAELAQSVAEDDSIEQNQKARELITQISQDINNEEITFEEAAAEYSDDETTAQSGGELGVSSPGDFVPEFEEALENLEIGEVSDVVTTIYGYHIIKLLDKTEEEGKTQYTSAHILLMTTSFEEWLTEQVEVASLKKYF